MDLGRDEQELKRLRRESLMQQTRQSVRDHQEIKRRRAKERAKPDGWDKGWLPEKVGRGEIYNGKNPSHYFQIPVMLMDLLIKNKRYGLSRCAMNLLNLIIVKTIGQFFSPINGARVFWKLPKNSELAKMLKFKSDQTSKAISFLSKLNVIIVKGYRDRWVCIHPRLYGMSRDDLVKMKIDWDEIKPDRNWWVNTLKGKIWHYDPKEENLSGREHVEIDQALERAIKYAEKNIWIYITATLLIILAFVLGWYRLFLKNISPWCRPISVWVRPWASLAKNCPARPAVNNNHMRSIRLRTSGWKRETGLSGS